jgi:hypothetical protein
MGVPDGFVKSSSAVFRCILSHCGVQVKYASFRRICAPCICCFLLCRLIFDFLGIHQDRDEFFLLIFDSQGVKQGDKSYILQWQMKGGVQF